MRVGLGLLLALSVSVRCDGHAVVPHSAVTVPTHPLQPCATPRCPVLVRSGHCPTHARQRELARPNASIRKFYKSARWLALRRYRLALQPMCVQCSQERRATLATDIDHIKPHRGDESLFWLESNLQSLCHACHSRKTRGGA